MSQARLAIPTGQGGSRGRGRRPRTILSGLMRCGVCGGAYIAANRSHYGCGRHKDRGPDACDNRLQARRDHLEHSVIELLRDDLLMPASIEQARRQVRAQLAGRKNGKVEHQRDVAAKRAEIARITDAVVRMGGSDALLARLRQAEAELSALEHRAVNQPIPDIMPGALDRYRQMIDHLPQLLLSHADRAALSGIIQRITLRPEGGALWADLEGNYAGLCIEARTPGMVAGARYVTWKRTLRAA